MRTAWWIWANWAAGLGDTRGPYISVRAEDGLVRVFTCTRFDLGDEVLVGTFDRVAAERFAREIMDAAAKLPAEVA